MNELGYFGGRLNIPQNAGSITRTGYDLAVVEETSTGEVSAMCVQLAGNADRRFLASKVVDGADVVQTATCDKMGRRGEGTGHNPRRA